MSRILIACEESQAVCIAFRERGHEAFSADIQECSGGHPEWHIKGDVLEILNDEWDMMIAFPPCTYLTTTGNKWMKPEFATRFPGRKLQRWEAVNFFIKLVSAPIKRIAIENPKGVMSSIYRKPDQYVHPYHFGEPESKMTGLWLKNLSKLVPTNIVEPIWHICANGKREPSWHMKTMAVTLANGARAKARSKTFPGIARAMATQWSDDLTMQ